MNLSEAPLSMIFGITGKIGSGKHTVARILEKQGFFIIDADKLAHELYVRGSDLWHKLVDTFGKKIVGKNYEINRIKLAEIVFTDLSKLKRLNAIVHPELFKLIKKEISEKMKNNHNRIVIIAALGDLINLKDLTEKVILVKTSIEKRIERLKQNRGLSEKEILQRNDSQKEIQNYDVEIVNDGSSEELEKKVADFLLFL